MNNQLNPRMRTFHVFTCGTFIHVNLFQVIKPHDFNTGQGAQIRNTDPHSLHNSVNWQRILER